MTLRLRRKHQTTAPNFREASTDRSADRPRPGADPRFDPKRLHGWAGGLLRASRIWAGSLLAGSVLAGSLSGGPTLRAGETDMPHPTSAETRSLNWDVRRPTLHLTAESLRFGSGPPRSTFQAFEIRQMPESAAQVTGSNGLSASYETSAPTQARPASGSAVSRRSSGLGWRAPVVPALAHESDGDDSPIRQASYPSLGPAQASRTTPNTGEGSRRTNPFDDPFSDRARTSTVQQPDLPEPGLQQPGLQQPGPAFDPEGLEEVPPSPPPQSERRLPPGSTAGNSAQSCQPAFNNDRDCCAELEVCRTARDLVRSATLDRISVDITPRFLPDENDPVEEHRRQVDQLGRSPDRVWRDRDGQELARGRMADFARGRVQVVDSAGQTTDLHYNDLHTEDLCFVTAWWSLPSECGLGLEPYQGRAWIPLTMTWKASAVCNKPLYFEEVQLERYGHTTGPVLEPVLSAAHFFINIAVLPYKAGIHPPHECQYALGYYRPGSCAPWLLPPVPLSLRGALAEAVAVGAVIAVLPH